MTAPIPEIYGNISPWHEYVGTETAARTMYLQVVARAHAEYLVGPWADRDAYTTVERQAWLTYHAAGRTAWLRYRAAIESPQRPPAPAQDYGAANLPIFDSVGRPPQATARPQFTPTEGNEAEWPPN